jgi:hypothetical protein
VLHIRYRRHQCSFVMMSPALIGQGEAGCVSLTALYGHVGFT